MAISTAIKFFKGNYGSTAALNLSTQNVGGIVFDNTSHQIFVGGVAYGGNITDVSFDNSVLTISKATGGNITLDFSDTASATATLKVFQHMNKLIGTATNDENLTAEYAGTHYLTSAGNLIAADKALDTAIYNLGTRIDDLDGSATIATKTGNVITLKAGVVEDGGMISNSEGADITLATVAATGASEDVTFSTTAFVSTNVKDALIELKDAITGANITIDGHKGLITSDTNTMEPVAADGGKIGVKTDNVYIGSGSNGVTLLHVDTNASSNTGSDLATVNTVTAHISTAIDALDVTAYNQAEIVADAIRISNIKEENGKIGSTAYTTINVDGTVSEANPLVTKDSISSAIEGLDVDSYVQASVSGDTITIYGINEQDGKISHIGSDVTIKLGSNYNAETNKVALQSNIKDAINNLDTTADVVPVTASDTNTQIKLTLKGIKEENGVIADGTTTSTVTFSTVAATGAASDVSITDAGSLITATNVEGALQEIATNVKAMASGMRYNGDISNTTATLNSDSNDIRPGDIYLANAAFTIGNTSVEAGDMIVYKGNQSSSPVTLTNSNCTIIERETDVMVTAAGTLDDGYLVLGSGDKEVVTSSITETALQTAITNANSALQSIGKGTDGAFVTTTISEKANNNQNVSVALTQSTVTYSAGNLTATDGVLTNSAVAPIKNYVDGKIDALEVPTQTIGSNVEIKYSETDGVVAITSTEKYATIGTDLSVTNPNQLVRGFDIGTVKNYIDSKIGSGFDSLDSNGVVQATNGNIRFEYDETNGIVTIGTMTETYATIEQSGSTSTAPDLTVSDTTTGLVKGTDITKVKTYVDNKVGYAINQLDSIGTSDDAAVARVEVVETDGEISDVIVTNISADVTYTAASGNNPANIAASTTTGAVTGADITKIKSYVDAAVTASATVSDTLSTVAVNSGAQTEIAVIGTTPIHTAVTFTWDEYADPDE